MSVVASWTGSSADALRQALRLTNEGFAAHLGVAVRTVAYWRAQPQVIPRPAMQQILDAALVRAPEQVRQLFQVIQTAGAATTLVVPPIEHRDDDLDDLTPWLAESDIDDGAIDQAESAALKLAAAHTKVPAQSLVRDVLRVHQRVQDMLRAGHPRPRQARTLLNVDGMVLAHASVLLSDLGRDALAVRYGRAAQLCLLEADASQAPAWYALAKTARWQHDYATAANLAERGFDPGAITPMTAQLASYEANAAALLGDVQRARDALRRSEQITAALRTVGGEHSSPWAFPAQRRAVFRLSVLLRTGDPRGALEAAAEADEGWAAGELRIPGTWAQVRIGTAMAHLLRGEPDAAVSEVQPVLEMPPDLRISTVTGWLADLDQSLKDGRHASGSTSIDLRRQIRDFRAAALPSRAREAA